MLVDVYRTLSSIGSGWIVVQGVGSDIGFGYWTERENEKKENKKKLIMLVKTSVISFLLV